MQKEKEYESLGSIILLLITGLALFWSNSIWSSAYFNIFNDPIVISFRGYEFPTTINHIINELLMSIFFLFVTLEIKRELVAGTLQHIKTAIMPFFGALGGILLPASLYLVLNWHNPMTIQGWAIPTATDIAFSLAILNLLKDYVPREGRILLTALAIIDDLGAIIIIALFYTKEIQILYLILALFLILFLVLCNRYKIRNLTWYLAIGSVLWILIFKSGVHSTIAGVILALIIPYQGFDKRDAPLLRLEKSLHPWVVFVILPLFALGNTGVNFSLINLNQILNPVTLGIILGLYIGKQLGVFLGFWLAVKSKLAKLHSLIDWQHLYGISILSGIGFTMSLFIGELSFSAHAEYKNYVKLGVFIGSILSGITGSIVLRASKKSAPPLFKK